NFSRASFWGADIKFDAEDVNFSSADFTEAKIQGRVRNGNFSDARFDGAQIATIGATTLSISNSTMARVDFSTVNYIPSLWFVATDLTGANFAGVDLSLSFFWGTNNMQYANLQGASLMEMLRLGPALLGNAWWTDGSRCAVPSIGVCLPKLLDNGLTYAEYLSGKSDLAKDLDILGNAAKRVAGGGKTFVKEVFSVFGF
ncbi:MAG: hypothetical protein CVU24_17635, partial [Betaproteobacteria bacterium HGW-Betaproteobacteria-18]